jgi:hypothetical protein
LLSQATGMYTSPLPRIVMFCIYCGASNPENACFCSACGKQIGAPADPAPVAEAASPSPGSAATPRAEPQPIPQATAVVPQPTLQPTTQAMPQPQYPSAGAGKGKPVLWILAGFAACLLIVIAVALGSRLNQNSSGTEAARANAVPDAAPAAYTAPAAAPAADNTPAPASAPVQAPPAPAPAAPQNPIVGEWKTTTAIGDTVLNFGADGRYTIKSILVSEAGVYVFSSGDGTLRLQPNALFSHDIVVWSCQLSGDAFSCVDPEGAGHVYNRFR